MLRDRGVLVSLARVHVVSECFEAETVGRHDVVHTDEALRGPRCGKDGLVRGVLAPIEHPWHMRVTGEHAYSANDAGDVRTRA